LTTGGCSKKKWTEPERGGEKKGTAAGEKKSTHKTPIENVLASGGFLESEKNWLPGKDFERV